MKKFLLIGFAFLNCATAGSDVLPANGNALLQTPEIITMCDEMSTNHADDLAKLELLRDELQQLTSKRQVVSSAEKISELVAQIRDYAARIIFIAKPEWNSEIYPVALTWKIPNDLFFDNSDYLDLKQKVRDAPFGKAPAFAQFAFFLQNQVTEKKLVAARLLGSERTDIVTYFNINAVDGRRNEYDEDRSFLISYKKMATALEICQFLRTLIFEVKINYVKYMLGQRFEFEKSLFLVYRKED